MEISSLNMAKTESSDPRSACGDRNKDRRRRPGFHVISRVEAQQRLGSC